MVYRLFVEKRPELAHEANGLLSELRNLVGITALESLRVINRYDVENIDAALFERLKKSALGRRTRDLDSFESTCFRVCAYELDGMDYFRFPEAYATVTPEAVADLLAQIAGQTAPTLAIVYPKEES